MLLFWIELVEWNRNECFGWLFLLRSSAILNEFDLLHVHFYLSRSLADSVMGNGWSCDDQQSYWNVRHDQSFTDRGLFLFTQTPRGAFLSSHGVVRPIMAPSYSTFVSCRNRYQNRALYDLVTSVCYAWAEISLRASSFHLMTWVTDSKQVVWFGDGGHYASYVQHFLWSGPLLLIAGIVLDQCPLPWISPQLAWQSCLEWLGTIENPFSCSWPSPSQLSWWRSSSSPNCSSVCD